MVAPVPGATGYQIVYGLKPNFKGSKKKTVLASLTNTYTIGALAGNKYYYIKVRAYRTIGKKKVYGPFSMTASQFVARAIPNVSSSNMRVKDKIFSDASDMAFGDYKWVQYTIKNNGALSLKLKNKVGWFSVQLKLYCLGNSKGKEKSSITIKAGKSATVRIMGK